MKKREFFRKDGKFINSNGPSFLGGYVQGGTPRFYEKTERDSNSVSALDDRNSSLSKMSRDKTMMKHIREGNPSDSGLKRDALIIERENNSKRKENWLTNKRAKIAKMKREFKIK